MRERFDFKPLKIPLHLFQEHNKKTDAIRYSEDSEGNVPSSPVESAYQLADFQKRPLLNKKGQNDTATGYSTAVLKKERPHLHF